MVQVWQLVNWITSLQSQLYSPWRSLKFVLFYGWLPLKLTAALGSLLDTIHTNWNKRYMLLIRMVVQVCLCKNAKPGSSLISAEKLEPHQQHNFSITGPQFNFPSLHCQSINLSCGDQVSLFALMQLKKTGLKQANVCTHCMAWSRDLDTIKSSSAKTRVAVKERNRELSMVTTISIIQRT